MVPIIKVRSKTDVVEGDLRQFAERRIGFALDHLRQIRRVDISLEDVNGPKGGVDKRCRIRATLGFARVLLEESQTDWQIAVARAIHRLDQTATQRLQRMNRTTFIGHHRAQRRDALRAGESWKGNDTKSKSDS